MSSIINPEMSLHATVEFGKMIRSRFSETQDNLKMKNSENNKMVENRYQNVSEVKVNTIASNYNQTSWKNPRSYFGTYSRNRMNTIMKM